MGHSFFGHFYWGFFLRHFFLTFFNMFFLTFFVFFVTLFIICHFIYVFSHVLDCNFLSSSVYLCENPRVHGMVVSLSPSLQTVHQRHLDPLVDTTLRTLTHGRDTHHCFCEGVSLCSSCMTCIYVIFSDDTNIFSDKAANIQDWTSHARQLERDFHSDFFSVHLKPKAQ